MQQRTVQQVDHVPLLGCLHLQVARMNQLLPQMELLQREVAEQGSARHALLAALEAKANVEDVNKALAEVCQQLEIRSATGGSAAALSSDGHASVPTARWLWKSCATLVSVTRQHLAVTARVAVA
eukprot:1150749-Pelagomonas_calceolata.AAC.5